MVLRDKFRELLYKTTKILHEFENDHIIIYKLYWLYYCICFIIIELPGILKSSGVLPWILLVANHSKTNQHDQKYEVSHTV